VLRFGTDGVRGDAEHDLTDPFVTALGRAAARVLDARRFVVGRDTRASGARIEQALCVGLQHEGVDVTAVDVLPTPAIAYLAQRDDAAAAVISASHNPWTDNGIKLMAVGGRKLPDVVEARVEHEMRDILGAGDVVDGVFTGHVEDRADAYVDHLVAALEGRMLNPLRVVIDGANGAAYAVGPRALRAAGADVSVLHDQPDGRNINERCGSTAPSDLQHAVREHRADIGLALDGDADRVIAVDEHGEIVDGDQIMTALALDFRARGRLPNDAIAVTVMSNLGLRRALAAAGIAVVETPVGDRNVLVALEEHGLALGGEQSGHVIFSQLATTGDGVLTGMLLCDLVARSGRPLSEIASVMPRFPQVLVSVPVAHVADLEHAGTLQSEIERVTSDLGDRGRVLVRASGTEPVVRVMVEAATEAEAAAAVTRLRRAVETAFAG
jgi:phosphoglucosamine mutase